MNIISLFTTILIIISGPQISQSDDVGLIGYFEGNCPGGWKDYTGLVGRVPVGAGNYIGTARDGEKEAIVYNLGDKGGEVAHSLLTEEIPLNVTYDVLHESVQNATVNGENLNVTVSYPNRSDDGIIETRLEEIKALPHANMPPYLVLTPCKKVADKTNSLEVELSDAKDKILVLEGSLAEIENLVSYLIRNEIREQESFDRINATQIAMLLEWHNLQKNISHIENFTSLSDKSISKQIFYLALFGSVGSILIFVSAGVICCYYVTQKSCFKNSRRKYEKMANSRDSTVQEIEF